MRKLVKPSDLNPAERLFGGQLLMWIDEVCAIVALDIVGWKPVTTKYMSAINFVAPVKAGEVVEIGTELTHVGRSSFTLRAAARIMQTKRTILTIEQVVMVAVDKKGVPRAHGLAPLKAA